MHKWTFTFILFTTVAFCTSLKCYDCHGSANIVEEFYGKCGNYLKAGEVQKVKCKGGCYKVQLTTLLGTETRRGCDNYPASESDTCTEEPVQGVTGTYCICFTNLCNTGSSMTPKCSVTSLLLAIFTFTFAGAFYVN